jgi:hypothetical protein
LTDDIPVKGRVFISIEKWVQGLRCRVKEEKLFDPSRHSREHGNPGFYWVRHILNSRLRGNDELNIPNYFHNLGAPKKQAYSAILQWAGILTPRP